MIILQLADAYLSDKDSPFHGLRYCTREGYQRNIARIVTEIGDREVGSIGTRELLHLHAKWMESGVALAHQLATQLRILVGFGATILEDADCQRLRGLLAGLRFKNAKPRTTWITPEQVKLVRDEAFSQNWLSIALAQAFQFDCALRQRDVLGEWIPVGEPEPSTILSPDGQMKWVRGLTREEVSDDMVLTHKTSKRGQVLIFPLKWCPAVMVEWYAAPPSGPLIIDPQTELPFEAWKYRRIWRELATKAGVPANVWNMDSRAGRITQVLASGASLEDARKLAGHNQQSTTSRYSRGTPEAIERALSAVKNPDDDLKD